MKQRRKCISFKDSEDEKKILRMGSKNSKRTKLCMIKLAGESTSAALTAAVILSELLKKVIQVKHYLQEILTLMNLFCFETYSF